MAVALHQQDFVANVKPIIVQLVDVLPGSIRMADKLSRQELGMYRKFYSLALIKASTRQPIYEVFDDLSDHGQLDDDEGADLLSFDRHPRSLVHRTMPD